MSTDSHWTPPLYLWRPTETDRKWTKRVKTNIVPKWTKRLDASEYACFGMQAFRPLFLSYNLKKFETEVTAMKRNVSLDKQSKKAQKEYYSGLRRTWNGVDPATRTMPNGKAYNRSKEKHRIGRELRDGFPADSVFFCFLSAETGAIPLPAHLKLYTEPMQKRNAILPDLGYNR